MLLLFISALAGDFGRQEETLRVTRYARLRGEGPVYGRWRNRRGAFLAWRFRDGQIEHVEVFDGKTHTETRTFHADGTPRATVDWATKAVTLHHAPETTVPTQDWTELTLGGMVFRAPALTEESDGRWTAAGLALQIQETADPFSDDFGTALRAGCGCELEARMTAWIGGKPAAHYRLQRPDQTADVVALPIDDGLLVMTAAGADLSALAPLRAMMATAKEAR